MTFRGDDLTTPAMPDTSQAPQHGFLATIPIPIVCRRFSRKAETRSGHGMLVMLNVTDP
jgi:hypothetical protein